MLKIQYETNSKQTFFLAYTITIEGADNFGCHGWTSTSVHSNINNLTTMSLLCNTVNIGDVMHGTDHESFQH